MRRLAVCALDELPLRSVRIVSDSTLAIGVYNLGGDLNAIEDRCSHDGGPLADGEFDAEDGVAVCPRHGARFDIRSGRAFESASRARGEYVRGHDRGRRRNR